MTAMILCFLYIGLFSVGGGLSAISLIQTEVVECRGWLTEEALIDLMAIAEMTPGPIAVNAASFVGMRLHGFSGAAVATCACILPGCLTSYAISRVSERLRQNRRWQSAMKTLRAAIAGIVLNGGLTILKNDLIPMASGYTNGICPDIPALICFCIGLTVYFRWKPPPMLFMLIMGTVCGILRWLLLTGLVGS